MCSSLFADDLAFEEKADCFANCILTCMCAYWFVCVSVTLPHGAIDWSVIYDCDTTWSYALALKLVTADSGFSKLNLVAVLFFHTGIKETNILPCLKTKSILVCLRVFCYVCICQLVSEEVMNFK